MENFPKCQSISEPEEEAEKETKEVLGEKEVEREEEKETPMQPKPYMKEY